MYVQHKYFILFCTFSVALCGEPRFNTRFEYDEQLLEKMIRMEFEYAQWEKRINETLGKMEKQKTSIQTDLKILRNDREEFDKHGNETMKNMMHQLSKPQNATVLFRACDVVDYTLSTGNDIIIFNEMLYNIGRGYDSATGKFTAPVTGIYLFIVNLCPTKSGSIFFAIVAKEGVVANGHAHSVSNWLCVSGDAIVQLHANDVVYVKSTYSGSKLLQRNTLKDDFDAKANSFSGVLLHSI
ncbi:caprin-2-like [Mya arenaria]|uniref:caprin-2-like n=1 Tax=Mya arenaria TaxID=6604 RepID=UPI0022E5CF46|nr:caprin-2-like [Mya arenaria]